MVGVPQANATWPPAVAEVNDNQPRNAGRRATHIEPNSRQHRGADTPSLVFRKIRTPDVPLNTSWYIVTPRGEKGVIRVEGS